MTDEELLIEVKKGLRETGTFSDDSIKIYIAEVKEKLVGAGVPESYVNSSKSVGLITIGVDELLYNKNGNGELSNYFMQRMYNLTFSTDTAETEANNA